MQLRIKRTTLINWLVIFILGWFGIRAVYELITNGVMSSYILLLVELLLLILYISQYGVNSLWDKRLWPIVIIWFVYIFIFVYHVNEKRAISQALSLLFYRQLFVIKTLGFILVAVLFKKAGAYMEKLFYHLFLFLFFLSFVILFWLIKEYGMQFIYLEATFLGSHISLITFSYFIVFNSIIGVYLLSRKDLKYDKKIISILLILSVCLIMVMGKRGAILSLVVPTFLLFFFQKLSFKRILIYIGILFILYFIAIGNIDTIFKFISFFSERLSSALSDAYYFGDNNGRDLIWESGIEQFQQKPIFGYYPKIIDVDTSLFFYGLHPHNYWIEALMTMGLFGSIPFFCYIVYILITKFYYAIASNTPYRFWAVLLISEIIHGTFSSPLCESNIWLALFVLSCFTKATVKSQKKYDITNRK